MHRRWIPSQWHYLWLVLSLNHLSFPALIITDDNGHFQFFFRTPLFVRFFSLRFHTPFVIDNLIFQLKQYLQASNSHLPPIFHVISWDNIIILKANGTYVNSKNPFVFCRRVRILLFRLNVIATTQFSLSIEGFSPNFVSTNVATL